MRKVAAKRAAVADLGVGDRRCSCLGEERGGSCDLRIELELPVTDPRSEVEGARSRINRNGRLIVKRPDINQDGRLCHTEIHRGHKALTTGQKHCVVAMLCLEGQGFVACLRAQVIEWGWFHDRRDSPLAAQEYSFLDAGNDVPSPGVRLPCFLSRCRNRC